MWIFAWKLRQKCQTSKKRADTLIYPNHTCDTAFESLDITLFDTNIFGHHGGTHGTHKKQFSIEHKNQRKTDSTNPQMTLYNHAWYPNGTQNVIFKKVKV